MESCYLGKPSHPTPSLTTVALFLLVGMTVACQPSDPDAADVTAAPKPAPITAGREASESETREKEVVEPSPEIVPPQSKKPLSLNLPPDIYRHNDQPEDMVFNNEEKLPNLFGREKTRNSTSASTRLLLEEENPDLRNPVNGVEVSIEKKF